jgi:hypothetical protein
VNQLRTIGLCSLAGLAITAGIGAAAGTVSSTPARRASGSQRAPVRATLDRERLRIAIWMKESSGESYPRPGDNGRSIGPYQVQRARWSEYALPGERYRHMTPTQWHAWMRRAISGYLLDCPREATIEQQVRHVGAQHNGSGPKARAYGRDIWKRYSKGAKP